MTKIRRLQPAQPTLEDRVWEWYRAGIDIGTATSALAQAIMDPHLLVAGTTTWWDILQDRLEGECMETLAAPAQEGTTTKNHQKRTPPHEH